MFSFIKRNIAFAKYANTIEELNKRLDAIAVEIFKAQESGLPYDKNKLAEKARICFKIFEEDICGESEYNWSVEQPISVPSLSPNRITIFYVMSTFQKKFAMLEQDSMLGLKFNTND